MVKKTSSCTWLTLPPTALPIVQNSTAAALCTTPPQAAMAALNRRVVAALGGHPLKIKFRTNCVGPL